MSFEKILSKNPYEKRVVFAVLGFRKTSNTLH